MLFNPAGDVITGAIQGTPTSSLGSLVAGAATEYTTTFVTSAALNTGNASTIIVVLPAGTGTTGLTAADVTVAAPGGAATAAGGLTGAGGLTLTITVPDAADVDAGEVVTVIIGVTNKVTNPVTVGARTFTVATDNTTASEDQAAVTSASYTITGAIQGTPTSSLGSVVAGATTEYTTTFVTSAALNTGNASTIIVVLPAGTGTTGLTAADVTVAAPGGAATAAGGLTGAGGLTLTITVPDAADVDAGEVVTVIIGVTNKVTNPVTVGARTFTVATDNTTASEDQAAATSDSYTITFAPANKMAVTTQPAASTVAGVAFVPQPIVTIQDQFGNTVTDSMLTVTASLTTGAGSLTGTATEAAVAGVADFATNGMTIDLVGTDKVLTFNQASLTNPNVLSSSFTITFAAANKLTITTPPSASTVAGVAFGTQPVVEVQDAFGNTVTNSVLVVTAAKTTGAGTLSGTLTKAAVAGVADFTANGMSLELTGADKVLTFSATSMTNAVSSSFTITHAAASQYVIINPVDGTVDAAIIVAVQLQDQFGNVTTGTSGTVTLVADGSATGQGVVTITNGVGNPDLALSNTVAETVNLTLSTPTPAVTVTSAQNVVFAASAVTMTPNTSVVAGATTQYTLVFALSGSGALTGASTIDITFPTGTTMPTGGGLAAANYTVTCSSAGGAQAPDIDSTVSSLVLTVDVPLASTCSNSDTVTVVVLVGAVAKNPPLIGVKSAGVDTSVEPTTVTRANAFTVIHDVAFKYVIIDPADGTVDAAVTVTVELQDQFGNLVTTGPAADTGVLMTMDGAASPIGPPGILFSGGTGSLDIVDNSMETVNLNLSDSESTSLDVTSTQNVAFAHGVAANMVTNAGPTVSLVAGVAFPTQPQVTIIDQYGYTVTTGPGSILVVTAARGTGTGTLSGTVTETAVAGVANFAGNGLFIDLAGSKDLIYSAPGIPSGLSATFSIIAGTATKLVVITQPSSVSEPAIAFAQQPRVAIQDVFGNTTINTNTVIMAKKPVLETSHLRQLP